MSERRDLQFVDTNVLIYAHDISAGDKRSRARDLIAGLWDSGLGALSIQVLQEFYVNVTEKVAKPLPPDVASQIVSDLSVWQVHRPGVEQVLDAIRLQQRYRISFWDAMIVVSAIELGCTTLWSEDLNPGQVCGLVKVATPF
jgi:predicted nucleic acid-binding protein